MVRKDTDVAEYDDNMECLDSDIMDQTLATSRKMDFGSFTRRDVESALDSCDDPYSFAALLSPTAEPYLEDMAAKAKQETRKHFGNSVCLFTPLYVSNYCTNRCVYCGFNSSNHINRACLTLDEVTDELDSIASTGLKEVLILTGESRVRSDVEYIGECVRLASERFGTVGIEVYPMKTDEYAHIHSCGADYVTVFQETYDTERYGELHLAGPKRVFSYRFDAQERALRGGMRGVAFGTLLGLSDDPVRDAFSCGLHANLVQRKYPHAEISMSLPRLRPAGGVENDIKVSERQLLQVSLAYRLFLPFAGQTISTRERPGFRDGIVGLSATKISAGVSVGIGEHSGDAHGDGQFVISDPRGVEEIVKALKGNGLQPVMNDYVRV